ncbi:MAG: 1-deoxy-D-xylulose-5-phosphate reductoisomerase [Mangrovibacterium sp.]
MTDNKKKIAILGSTGSIGTQALEVIGEQSELFEVEALAANNNVSLLIEQALHFKPNVVVIANEAHYPTLRDALAHEDIKCYAGSEALAQVVQMDSIDVVLTAMVGYAGLRPTLCAIEAGKHIALANKETLVVAGEIITEAALRKGVNIYPVDSEHSAIFQCLVGEHMNEIEKIILTASGGPFRKHSLEELANISKADALKHPNWAMGAKITIDSASMMNKGFEVIEAKWLFGLKPDQIEVIVHPQSIVHSLVQFTDGSLKAQMGMPDMKLPIQYALTFPQRLKTSFQRFNFMDYPQLSFEKPDLERFPNLALASEAMEQGGNMPCIINAANEIAVSAFLKDEIRFLDMPRIISDSMQKMSYIAQPSIADYEACDSETRLFTQSLIKQKYGL